MPKESNMKASLDALKRIDLNVLRDTGQKYIGTSPDMPLEIIAKLVAGSKAMHAIFQPVINEAKLAKPLLKAVAEGNPEELIRLVQENPQLLFKKGQIKDPAGQVFYNISAYQMMQYLCDDDMFAQIMPLVPENITNEKGAQIDLKAMQKEQDQKLHHGGADLIKVNADPETLPDFDLILQHTETYTINNQQLQVTFPLMENKDAILYYKDDDNQTHWYYANRDTQTIELIIPTLITEEDKVTFNALEKSMDAMENNSARRSNDAEHAIITRTMDKSLVRNGIQYEQDGKRYCDSRHDFNRYYNAYRECIRLYKVRRDGDGDTVRCEKLGTAQKEVMWLLQRYCEKNRPFVSLPDFKSSPFKRGFQIYNLINGQLEDIYSSGRFIPGFGLNFALYKGAGQSIGVALGRGLWASWDNTATNFFVINRLVENAKKNIIEFKQEQGLSQGAPQPR